MEQNRCVDLHVGKRNLNSPFNFSHVALGFRLCDCSRWVSSLHICTFRSAMLTSSSYFYFYLLSHLSECGKSFYNLFHPAIVMASLWSSRADNCRLIVYKERTQPSGGCCALGSLSSLLFSLLLKLMPGSNTHTQTPHHC